MGEEKGDEVIRFLFLLCFGKGGGLNFGVELRVEPALSGLCSLWWPVPIDMHCIYFFPQEKGMI